MATKTDRIQIRVSPELKDRLAAQAEAEGRTLSNYIEQLIKRDGSAPKMKKHLVMRAIAHEIDSLWKVIDHPKNAGKAALVEQYGRQIVDLHAAYFELRGHTGFVVNVDGMDTEVQRVQRTYNTVIEMLHESAE